MHNPLFDFRIKELKKMQSGDLQRSQDGLQMLQDASTILSINGLDDYQSTVQAYVTGLWSVLACDVTEEKGLEIFREIPRQSWGDPAAQSVIGKKLAAQWDESPEQVRHDSAVVFSKILSLLINSAVVSQKLSEKNAAKFSNESPPRLVELLGVIDDLLESGGGYPAVLRSTVYKEERKIMESAYKEAVAGPDANASERGFMLAVAGDKERNAMYEFASQAVQEKQSKPFVDASVASTNPRTALACALTGVYRLLHVAASEEIFRRENEPSKEFSFEGSDLEGHRFYRSCDGIQAIEAPLEACLNSERTSPTVSRWLSGIMSKIPLEKMWAMESIARGIADKAQRRAMATEIGKVKRGRVGQVELLLS